MDEKGENGKKHWKKKREQNKISANIRIPIICWF